jgi:hypothetical protein
MCSAGGTLERFADYPNITARQIGSPRSPVAIVLGGKSWEDTSIDKRGETTMFNKASIALSVAIAFSAASGALATPVRVASNNSQYSSPDSTPNEPFFYVDTHGVPPTAQRQVRPPHRPLHKQLTSRPN